MEFPITVQKITFEDDKGPVKPDRLFGGKPGSWVAVRPIDGTKTYLGVLLGDYCPPRLGFDRATGTLHVGKDFLGNPAMWVPDLNRVVMGWESWWGEITKPEDLHQITDADIQNVWYVQALKALSAETKPAA